MAPSNFRTVVTNLLATAALLFGAQVAWGQTGPAEALVNFARVTNTLYRGAQPSPEGFSDLQKMGISIIVNLRDEPKEMGAEKREVESLGMKYVGIPWKGSDEPSNSQIVQFLDLVRANSQAKIFVHCQRGADRTGTMIAAYRVVVEHESVSDAVSEMRKFHYDHFWLPQLQRYVASLPRLQLENAEFSAYGLAPNAMSAAATAVTAIAP
jgi:protein tyrosine/serine phosphatase